MTTKRAALVAAGITALALLLTACPQTSTGGPHHTPPTVIIHKP